MNKNFEQCRRTGLQDILKPAQNWAQITLPSANTAWKSTHQTIIQQMKILYFAFHQCWHGRTGPYPYPPTTVRLTYPVGGFWLQAVRLVLELLDLARDLSHLAALAKVDEALSPLAGVLGPGDNEVAVPFLRQQDVGQVHTCSPDKGHAMGKRFGVQKQKCLQLLCQQKFTLAPQGIVLCVCV